MCCSKKETAVATRCKWQRPSQMTLQAAGLGNSGVVGKCHSAACRQWRCLHVQFRYDCRSHLCHYQHPHHRRHLTTRLLRRNYASFTNYNFDFKNVKIVWSRWSGSNASSSTSDYSFKYRFKTVINYCTQLLCAKKKK
jgi:hypothetical protein